MVSLEVILLDIVRIFLHVQGYGGWDTLKYYPAVLHTWWINQNKHNFIFRGDFIKSVRKTPNATSAPNSGGQE